MKTGDIAGLLLWLTLSGLWLGGVVADVIADNPVWALFGLIAPPLGIIRCLVHIFS